MTSTTDRSDQGNGAQTFNFKGDVGYGAFFSALFTAAAAGTGAVMGMAADFLNGTGGESTKAGVYIGGAVGAYVGTGLHENGKPTSPGMLVGSLCTTFLIAGTLWATDSLPKSHAEKIEKRLLHLCSEHSNVPAIKDNVNCAALLELNKNN